MYIKIEITTWRGDKVARGSFPYMCGSGSYIEILLSFLRNWMSQNEVPNGSRVIITRTFF